MRPFLLLYFLCTSFLNAQQLDKEQYDKGVDFVTCVCMNTVLKEKQVDCEKDKIIIEDIPSDQGRSIALFNEFQTLKREDKKSIDFLVNEIFENQKKYQKINAFAKKNATQLDSIKSRIRRFLTQEEIKQGANDASEQVKDSTIEEENAVPMPITSLIEKTNPGHIMEKSFFEENSIALILGVLLILLALYVISSIYNIKKRLETVDQRISNRVKIGEVPFGNQNSENRTNANLENNLRELSRKVSELENSIAKIPDTASSIEERHSINPPLMTMKEQVKNEVFYMSVPNEDGTFDVGGKTTKESALYEFIVDAQNQSLAKFSFAARDTKIIQSVVDYSQSYINPVCDPQNALNQNAKKITTIRPGTAEKRNDKWIVLTKAQIKYE